MMRIDIVSVFPAYLQPLELSLLGRARAAGLVEIHTHDLRAWTDDRHSTVDDAPFGGGAGMVMKPEPWGDAIDALCSAAPTDTPRLIVPTPAGDLFTQAMAEHLAAESWLIFACGRYEGIDQRVVDHYRCRLPVNEVSIGDYVLNGGEAAALVVIEAVTRLIPGFVGNPTSVIEESHATGDDGGLLEHPSYTRPARWRGLDVPDVLLSGDHGAVTRWRHQEAVRRTSSRRPDLVHASRRVNTDQLTRLMYEHEASSHVSLELATPGDAGELLTLQRACWLSEAQQNDDLNIPPLVESLQDVTAALAAFQTYVVRASGRLVASVRGRLDGDRWLVGRLMVAPDLQGRGLGRWLLQFIESVAPSEAAGFELFTGAASLPNLRLYKRAGYRLDRRRDELPGVVVMTKSRAAGDRAAPPAPPPESAL